MNRALLIATLALLTAVSLLWRPAAGEEMLTNGGLEEGTAGWTAARGVFTTVPSPVHAGLLAGMLHGTTRSDYEIYQWIEVGGGQEYAFSGWALRNDEHVQQIWLRVLWFDQEGKYISESKSSPLTADDASFQLMTAGDFSPPDARSARFTLTVRPVATPFDV